MLIFLTAECILTVFLPFKRTGEEDRFLYSLTPALCTYTWSGLLVAPPLKEAKHVLENICKRKNFSDLALLPNSCSPSATVRCFTRWMLHRGFVLHKHMAHLQIPFSVPQLHNRFWDVFVDSNWVERGHIAIFSKKDIIQIHLELQASPLSWVSLKLQQASRLLRSHPQVTAIKINDAHPTQVGKGHTAALRETMDRQFPGGIRSQRQLINMVSTKIH